MVRRTRSDRTTATLYQCMVNGRPKLVSDMTVDELRSSLCGAIDHLEDMNARLRVLHGPGGDESMKVLSQTCRGGWHANARFYLCHQARCLKATPEERAFFRDHGRWPPKTPRSRKQGST